MWPQWLALSRIPHDEAWARLSPHAWTFSVTLQLHPAPRTQAGAVHPARSWGCSWQPAHLSLCTCTKRGECGSLGRLRVPDEDAQGPGGWRADAALCPGLWPTQGSAGAPAGETAHSRGFALLLTRPSCSRDAHRDTENGAFYAVYSPITGA